MLSISRHALRYLLANKSLKARRIGAFMQIPFADLKRSCASIILLVLQDAILEALADLSQVRPPPFGELVTRRRVSRCPKRWLRRLLHVADHNRAVSRALSSKIFAPIQAST